MTDDRFDANKWYTQKKPVSVSSVPPKPPVPPIPPSPPNPFSGGGSSSGGSRGGGGGSSSGGGQPTPIYPIPQPKPQKSYLSTILIILSILAVIVVAIILIVLVDPFSGNYAATVSEIVNKINFAEQFEKIRFN